MHHKQYKTSPLKLQQLHLFQMSRSQYRTPQIKQQPSHPQIAHKHKMLHLKLATPTSNVKQAPQSATSQTSNTYLKCQASNTECYISSFNHHVFLKCHTNYTKCHISSCNHHACSGMSLSWYRMPHRKLQPSHLLQIIHKRHKISDFKLQPHLLSQRSHKPFRMRPLKPQTPHLLPILRKQLKIPHIKLLFLN